MQGRVRVDVRTKRLVRRLGPGEVAVIDHADLDEVGARALAACRPAAIVNCSLCSTGRYPNRGPALLLASGLPVLEGTGPAPLALEEGAWVRLVGESLWRGGREVARGRRLTAAAAAEAEARGRANQPAELRRFLANTLARARLEQELVLSEPRLPPIGAAIAGRHALLVARGRDFRQDLAAIRAYVRQVRPVLVGVDGGADALLELGYRPDLIVGDMDSVSDRALICGAELVVHAYPDGRAPGLARVHALGLTGTTFPCAGTSEDAALLLVHHLGAAVIVAVGSHTDMLDFLDKGRPGMASTLLVRLKVGPDLVDIKGLSRLYPGRPALKELAPVALAACLPAAAAAVLSPGLQGLLRLWWLRVLLLMQGV